MTTETMSDTLDPLASPDARGLLAAIDAGDDGALPFLADLLEEAGDPRAAGLRRAVARRPVRAWAAAEGPHFWTAGPADLGRDSRAERERHPEWYSYELPREVFARLEGGELRGQDGPASSAGRYYPTRSAAMLALAEALADA